MLFSSITFLYYFLPALLLVYHLTPRRLKNAVLLMASLLFYAWGEPRFTLVMVLTAMAGYLSGITVNRLTGNRLRRLALASAMALITAPLLVYKYGGFITGNLNAVRPGLIAPLQLVLPIGVSFYTFQILSYVIDVYRMEVEAERNPFNFLMYVSLFPQLIAGPIVRFRTIQGEIRQRKVTMELFESGIVRFVAGLGKKVLLANTLAEFQQNLVSGGSASLLSSWMTALAFTLQIYFDFSGYSDMAIGLGRMFGFQFLENFDYPYLSRSVTEFWRRWHQSLGSWFRDYLYIPLGGSHGSVLKTGRNLLIVWLLTGLWHGASWNFVAWGFLYFLLLILERAGLGRLLAKLPALLSTAYTFLLVLLGFVLFNADNLAEALGRLKGMFGFNSLPLTDAMAVYYTKSYLLIMLIAAIGATPLPKRFMERMKGFLAGTIHSLAQAAGLVFVLLFSTSSLVDGSFNPFLYFRF
ncbi:MAG TPA: MBOAT family O-acyltransferase [Bacillota bacterium]|jgi:alginate O-acetyltransferase complex protein AlgI|nr:MBOAT family protein [Fastidiosipila sp.]HPX93535.1 MBOAT family O-acyltransferase [Bacillota bacterium]HQB81778.1 MBOAT family O-acyltransferase [Bacillota bacterium]